MIVSECMALTQPPHLLRPCIVGWLDVIPGEVTTKLTRRWQRSLIEALEAVEPLVRELALFQKQGPHQLGQIIYLSSGDRSFTVQVFGEGVKAAHHKLARVFKHQTAQTEGEVFFIVLGDDIDASLGLGESLHKEVGVVAPQIVEEHRQLIPLRIQPPLKVAGLVRRPAVCPTQVVVIANA